MTKNCDICGRGTAQRALTPTWYPHDLVCDRARCRAAALDAIEATIATRDQNDDLIGSIASRHESQMYPYGWRADAMSKIDVYNDETPGFLAIAKRVKS